MQKSKKMWLGGMVLSGLIGLMGCVGPLIGCTSPAERWPAYHGHEHTLTNGAPIRLDVDTNAAPAIYEARGGWRLASGGGAS